MPSRAASCSPLTKRRRPLAIAPNKADRKKPFGTARTGSGHRGNWTTSRGSGEPCKDSPAACCFAFTVARSLSSRSSSWSLVVEAWRGLTALVAAASIAQALTRTVARRCRATCSALVGRPRFGFALSLAGGTSTGTASPRTCRASQPSTSSMRQRSRFVPGGRQIGGSEAGLRLASLRMLATDL